MIPSHNELDFSKLVFTGRFSDILTNNDLKAYGGQEDERILNWLQVLDHTLGLWTLYVIFKTYERRLGGLRDAIADLNFSDIRRDAERLRFMEKDFLALSKNLKPFVYELERFCGDRVSFRHDVYDFQPVKKLNDKSPLLFEGLRKSLYRGSARIQEIENNLKEVVATSSQLISVILNERLTRTILGLQRWTMGLTVILVILTAFLLGLGALQLW